MCTIFNPYSINDDGILPNGFQRVCFLSPFLCTTHQIGFTRRRPQLYVRINDRTTQYVD